MSKRVVIVGRGAAGQSLAEDVARAGDVFLGYLDDRVPGDDVLGVLADVVDVVANYSVDVLYFAIPSASADVLRNFIALTSAVDVEIAIIPRTYRIVSRERVSLADLTDVDVLDLVGRAPVKHDMLFARERVQGRRVLVTGAAGSIGSRLVAQLCTLDPEIVVCLDRAESSMFHLGQSLDGGAKYALEIADVQSPARVRQIMRMYQPDLVFHVAAFKHVPLMQDHALEAFNNNVWGTLNVFQASAEQAAERVVYVSTDKAVRPTNVMGATKRLGELLMADMGRVATGTVFSGVRFGNVLESEGSVMQTFRRQLHRRTNLTVTHRDITRYFMTIDEAAQLVIQTATTGAQGDIFVLDMGEPIKVIDLAESLIEAVDPSLGVDIIGLRPGEKMFEELSYRASAVNKTTHPKISIVREEADRRPGETLEWVEGLLSQTLSFGISNDAVRTKLRDFGFSDLQ